MSVASTESTGARLAHHLGRDVVRAARYLVPLLRDALLWLWRVLLDLIAAAQFVWRWWQVRRHPDRADAFQSWRMTTNERRAVRWAPWHELTLGRRAAVTFAATLLVVVSAGWLLRPRSSIRPAQMATAAAGTAQDGADVRPAIPTTPAFDLAASAARMQSEIARVAQGRWVFLRGGPALPAGPPAGFDGFRVSSPAVVHDDGNLYHAWYRGCRLYGRAQDCAIGHATSADGIAWRSDAAPVLVPDEGADEFQLGGIAVVRANGKYFLWYSLEPSAYRHRPTSPLYLSTSDDGLRWRQEGRVLSAIEQIPWFIEPSAVHDGELFHLWFVDSLTQFEGHETKRPADGPFLRHLTSPDGRAWQDAGQFPLRSLERGRIHVTVSRDRDGFFRAFYFGRMPDSTAAAVGWLVSPDGTSWQIASTTAVTARMLGDDVRGIVSAVGLRDTTGTRVWFVADYAGGRQDVRAAFVRDSE